MHFKRFCTHFLQNKCIGAGICRNEHSYLFRKKFADVGKFNFGNVPVAHSPGPAHAAFHLLFANYHDVFGAYLVGNHVTVVGMDDDSIAVSDARKWRAQYYQKRAKAISDRLQKTETGTDGYDGQLIKDGSGILVLTGHNVYRGGTIVKGGKLLGFIDSFGTSGNDHSNGKVVVENGQFGIINSFVDSVTQTGKHVAHSKADHSVDITVQ